MSDRCLNIINIKKATKLDLSPSLGLAIDNVKTYLLVSKIDGQKYIRQQHVSNMSLPYGDFDIEAIYNPMCGFNEDFKTLKAIKEF